MDGLSHDDLVKRACQWLRNTIGCRGTTISDLSTAAPERADAIGWKSGSSYLVECKTSRTDFLRDKKKFFRRNPEMGIGVFRYYLCPPDIIKPDELPPKWGLLYCDKKIQVIKKAERQAARQSHEILILTSALRRLHSDLDEMRNQSAGRRP